MCLKRTIASMLKCMPMNYNWRRRLSSGKTSEVCMPFYGSSCTSDMWFKSTLWLFTALIIFIVNLGKWILRYLFSNLIDEEIKRDEAFRHMLLQEKKGSLQRTGAPPSIQIPEANMNGWKNTSSGPMSASTIRPSNGFHLPAMTPGLSIGLATPALQIPVLGTQQPNTLPTTTEEGAQLEKTQTQQSQGRDSSDYFSATPHPQPPITPTANGNGKPGASADTSEDAVPLSPSEPENANQTKKGNALFSKKFNMSFKMKKFGQASTPEVNKPVAADEKSEDSDSRSSKTDDRVVEDNFLGVIQKIRHGYEDLVQEGAPVLTSTITPSLPSETPVLKPPLATTILIQEDRLDSGGVADLFEGKVGSLGQQADLIEKVAPVWLADVLLRVSNRRSVRMTSVLTLLECYDPKRYC